MALSSIIISAIIFSIMSMAAFTQASVIIDIKEKNAEITGMHYVKKAILLAYNKTGVISTDLDELNSYSEVDLRGQKDQSKSEFSILNNGGVGFSFEGSGNLYSAVVVAKYADGLDSEITSNEFLKRNDEGFLLLTNAELAMTERGITSTKLVACSSASQNYFTINGIYPSDAIELVSGAFIEGKGILDSFGHNLVIDGSGACYSKGLNGIDDNKTSDDVFL